LEVLTKSASCLLSEHSRELQAAKELLKEVEAKTQESSHLLLAVKANLREFSVSLTTPPSQ
jgi:hypothetical protein